MRIARRLIGAILLTSLSAAPLGVAAEGYVCASSGMRMSHETRFACPHCAAASHAKAAYERPCCVYVGATALPPVLSTTSIALVAPMRVAAVVPPSVTAQTSAPFPLNGAPEYDADGGGGGTSSLTLVRSVQLKN